MTDNSPCHSVAACTLITRENGDVLMVKTGYRSGWEIPGAWKLAKVPILPHYVKHTRKLASSRV